MLTRDDRPYYINKIKEIVSSINDDIDDSGKVYELERCVKGLRRFIEWRHFGIYIAIYDVGPDDKHRFIRNYKLLGSMTETEALKRLSEIDEANKYYKHIREVTGEEWDDFLHLKYLTDISNRFDFIKKYNDIPENVVNDVLVKIEALREKLGLQYRWEYVIS